MSDYTPSTEFLRRMYATDTQAHEPFDYRLAEFDRWLAAHDAEVRADEREKAAQRVQEVPYWVDEGIADDTKLITMDFAIAAALDDPAYREWIQIITEERAAARGDGAE